MGSPLSSAPKRDEEAICVLLVGVGNASGSLRGSGDKLGIAINS